MKAAAGVVRVLVVDDEESVLEALTDLLAGPRVAVRTARSLAEALLLLEDPGFGLVITDLRLRGREDRDGFALLEWMRLHRPGTPVLVITGLGGRDFERQARRRGAAGCWRKSGALGDLLDLVERLGVWSGDDG